MSDPTHDDATAAAINEAIKVDKPVVASTTVEAMTWLGTGYAVLGVVLMFIPDMLAMVNLPEEAKWVAPLVLAISRVVERRVRFELQQRGA